MHFVSHQLCTSLSGKFFQFFFQNEHNSRTFIFSHNFPSRNVAHTDEMRLKKAHRIMHDVNDFNQCTTWLVSSGLVSSRLVLSCFVSIQLKSTEQHQECQSVLLCIHAVKSQICAQFKISQRDRLILCLCKRCQDWNWLAFYFHISDFICVAAFSLPCYRIE